LNQLLVIKMITLTSSSAQSVLNARPLMKRRPEQMPLNAPNVASCSAIYATRP